MGVACYIVLLSVLEHHLIESRADARRYHHTHGEHDAHPRREQLVGHALVGIHGDERVEQHHARSAYHDWPLHALQHAVGLHLEVHEERGGADEQESHSEEPLEVDALAVKY